MDVFEGLNDAQADAVVTTEGPLLILAGAGSGKTKTITHRIAHCIANEGAWPNRILAVTFTNKAAKEMRERLALLLQQDASSRQFMPWMGTFHSICVRLLRHDGDKIGVASNFIIYDEDDRRSLVKRAMKELGYSDKDIKVSAASSIISAEKNKLNGPDELAAASTYPYQQMIATIYRQYEMFRKEAGALDFDDILIEVVRLLREHADVRTKWRDTFRYIVIDEYQDTNAAQYAIVKALVNDQRNICVVGDDWQSIYSWRGADFKNILRFEQDFPGAKVVKLEQNYRSTEAILTAANNVIAKNVERTDKELWTKLGVGEPVHVTEYYDESEEANALADRIVSQVSIGARDYSDYTVLYRTNGQSYAVERALRQRFVPHQIIGGVRFFDRAVIKDVMAYIKLLYQPKDTASFSRIANTPTRGIGATSLEKFLAWRSQTGMDLIEAMVAAQEATTITARARNALSSLGATLRRLQALMSDQAPAEFIRAVVDGVGYRDHVNDGSPQAEDHLDNIDTLITEAQQYADFDTFLEEVSLMSGADTESEKGKVSLMTLHAAKGLEFPVVFMVGLEEGVFPHSRVFDAAPAELEEERRLCYVGVTRAREELYISYATSRQQFGQRSYNEPSRFIADMGLAKERESARHSFTQTIDDFFSDEIGLVVGDTVRSAVFGEGEVQEVDGMAVVVKFAGGTTKKLNAEFARLEKI